MMICDRCNKIIPVGESAYVPAANNHGGLSPRSTGRTDLVLHHPVCSTAAGVVGAGGVVKTITATAAPAS